MLANKKTILQINNDLQLFLGKNTEQFTQWLRKVVSSPELLDEPKEESDEGKEGKKVDELSEGEGVCLVINTYTHTSLLTHIHDI